MFKELLVKPIITDFWKPDGNIWGMCLPKGPIYHYTASIKTIESIISTGELWLSKSTVMNDFAEIKYGCELFLKLARKESSKSKVLDSIITSFEKAINNNVFGDIFNSQFFRERQFKAFVG